MLPLFVYQESLLISVTEVLGQSNRANVITVKHDTLILANLHWQRSLSLDHSTWNVDSELASEVYERWEKMKHGETCRSVQKS